MIIKNIKPFTLGLFDVNICLFQCKTYDKWAVSCTVYDKHWKNIIKRKPTRHIRTRYLMLLEFRESHAE